MNNAPEVKIEYLVNYDLVISGQDGVSDLKSSDLNILSDLTNINNQDAKLSGKKGFHFSSGAINDTTGEESGVLLNGAYTFYDDTQSAYKGIMGDSLSNDNYEFGTPQYITIRAKNENTYIRSLLIYFDPETSFIDAEGNNVIERASSVSFSNAKKYDIESGESNVDAPEYNSIKPIPNTDNVFMWNFGQEGTLTEIRININKWNKKNSLMKILKIVTGYTGVYNKTNIMKLDFNINKTNDVEQLRFGVSSNECVVDVLDNDLMINTLYRKELIYKNVEVRISIDDVIQGMFYINEKNSKKGSNEWIFDCVDRIQFVKEIKRTNDAH